MAISRKDLAVKMRGMLQELKDHNPKLAEASPEDVIKARKQGIAAAFAKEGDK